MKQRHRREARSIYQLSRSYRGPGTFSIDPPSCQGSVEIAIRKILEARQIARCQGGIEIT